MLQEMQETTRIQVSLALAAEGLFQQTFLLRAPWPQQVALESTAFRLCPKLGDRLNGCPGGIFHHLQKDVKQMPQTF